MGTDPADRSETPRVALSVNHVGVTVLDVFAAIIWYGAVFGLRCIMRPRLLEPAHHDEARSARGARFKRAWRAHLLAANGVGLELFQFIDPPVDDHNERVLVPYTVRGPWHVCLTNQDVEGTVEDRDPVRRHAAVRPGRLRAGTSVGTGLRTPEAHAAIALALWRMEQRTARYTCEIGVWTPIA